MKPTIAIIGWLSKDSSPAGIYLGQDGVEGNEAATKAQESGKFKRIVKLVNPVGTPMPHVPHPEDKEGKAKAEKLRQENAAANEAKAKAIAEKVAADSEALRKALELQAAKIAAESKAKEDEAKASAESLKRQKEEEAEVEAAAKKAKALLGKK